MQDTLAVTRPSSKNNTLKPAASVVSPMLQVDMFASGGYDHAIHAWKMKEDMLPTAETLAFNHTSVVQALLPVRDTSHKLISGGADCMMQVFDLSSERVSTPCTPTR
jgi:WD40 repeat protein